MLTFDWFLIVLLSISGRMYGQLVMYIGLEWARSFISLLLPVAS